MSWWLSIEGVSGEGDEIKEGVERHSQIERGLETIKKEEESSEEAEKGLHSFTLIAILLASIGILIVYFGYYGTARSANLAAIFILVALLWLLAGAYWLYLLLRSVEISLYLRAKHNIPKGQIEYSDRLHADSFFSEELMVSGKPDYILKKGDDHVPVEKKTGRIPRGPLFSHILQVGAYCMLLEEHYGRKPPYGIIEYRDNHSFTIDYDDKLKELILSKLKEMKLIMSGEKKAYRNHHRKNKCMRCSRRDNCAVKLA
jgi:CRISPR-associated exonuclease Cas4